MSRLSNFFPDKIPELVISPDYSKLDDQLPSLSIECSVYHVCRHLNFSSTVAEELRDFLLIPIRNRDFLEMALRNSGPFCNSYFYIHQIPVIPIPSDSSLIDMNAWLVFGHVAFWETFRITDMSNMFMFINNFNLPIGRWDVSNVVNMQSMFDYAKKFNQDLSRWNTSRVTDMCRMFEDAKEFNQPIGNWDVSSVQTMNGMFNSCVKFNQDLSRWDMRNVKSVWSMFMHARAFRGMIGHDVPLLREKDGFGTMFVGTILPELLQEYNDEERIPVLMKELEETFEKIQAAKKAQNLKKREFLKLEWRFTSCARELSKRRRQLL